MKKPWLVIDAPNLCWRAYHTTGSLDRGVTFGFLRAVKTLSDDFLPASIAFCFDYGKSLREHIYPFYKLARREKNQDPLFSESRKAVRAEIGNIRKEVLPALGYRNIFKQKGYEADDLIALVCRTLAEEGKDSIIVSSDHDLYQLLSRRITMWKPAQKTLYTEKTLAEEFSGLTPQQWPHVKAIAGCVSDGIPGIKGVGEITAAKYLRGKLKDTDKVTKKVLAAKAEWTRNLELTLLPWPGLQPVRLRKDKTDLEKWRKYAKDNHMPSLLRT